MERNEFFLKCFSAKTHLNQVIGQGVVLCHGAGSFLWTLTACDAWAEYPSELLNSSSFPFWWYLSKLYIKLIRLSNASQLPRVRPNVPYSATALCLPFPSVYHQANPRSSSPGDALQEPGTGGCPIPGHNLPCCKRVLENAESMELMLLSCGMWVLCFAVGGGLCFWMN